LVYCNFRRQVHEFNPQGLANTAFAFGRVGLANEKLLSAVARAAALRVAEFNP